MRWLHALDGAERARLAGFAGAIALLQLAGWGLFLWYARSNPTLGGLGALAYTFGLRHAFDVDHIAAIDNTTRKLLHDRKRPLGVGFFFSLGHSTIVFALVAGLSIAASAVNGRMSALEHWGRYVGTSVSGTFLWIIGVLNLLVLLDIVRIAREAKHGQLDESLLEERLGARGLVNRLVAGRASRLISSSWQMYPLGLLFGLGFDTATEIGLLAVAAGVATQQAPTLAVLSLPLLFAAGMCLMDTADGVFMRHAYSWAFADPVRRLRYDITVTSVSVAVALGIGSVELLQSLPAQLSFGAEWLQGLDVGRAALAVVALFAVTWVGSLAVGKARSGAR